MALSRLPQSFSSLSSFFPLHARISLLTSLFPLDTKTRGGVCYCDDVTPLQALPGKIFTNLYVNSFACYALKKKGEYRGVTNLQTSTDQGHESPLTGHGSRITGHGSRLVHRCANVPVIFVRRSAQENASMDTGSKIAANSNRISSGRVSANTPAPCSSAARIPSSA
jgi:hypothetical protein